MNWWIPVQQCRTSCTRQPHLLSKSSSSRPRHGMHSKELQENHSQNLRLLQSSPFLLSSLLSPSQSSVFLSRGASTTYSTRSVAGQLASWKTFSGLLIIVVGSEIVNILIEETLDFEVVPIVENFITTQVRGPDPDGKNGFGHGGLGPQPRDLGLRLLPRPNLVRS
uniref:Uncharacterized protein n=1 Tax=Salix viminalis TaxID=40686 RepID=A0A6N2N4M4_SALVM